MKNKVYIYGLAGDNGKIRYVGKSIRPNIRKKEHIFESLKTNVNTHKTNWIRKTLNNGEDLHITILEECNDMNWPEREKYWISELDNLTNLTDGGEGNSGIKYPMPYCDVKKWVNENLPHITSENEWRKYIKMYGLPDFIPNRPDSRYKNDGWISWSHLFNKVFLNYTELKKLVNENNIKTYKEYKNFIKPNMPTTPQTFYKEWNSWYDFLNKPKQNKKIKPKFLSLEELKVILKPLLLTTKKEYVNWYSLNKGLGYPSSPNKFYKNSGWVSWEDLFGNSLPKNIQHAPRKKNKHFLNYKDCQKWVSENLPHITSENKWRKITNTLPKFIPKRPDFVYKNNRWSCWASFLN